MSFLNDRVRNILTKNVKDYFKNTSTVTINCSNGLGGAETLV